MKRPKAHLIVFLSVCCIFFSFRRSSDPIDKLARIAKEYKQYECYKKYTPDADSTQYNWTIVTCRWPGHYKIDTSFISEADKSTSLHGNKLYKLYIKDYRPYVLNRPEGQPKGQVIVKETWNVREIVYDSSNHTIQQMQSRNDGKWYTPTTVSELFIMYKERERTDNDKGWNYGTVSIEDKNKRPMLLNDMKISTCVGCHKGTKYDRIFGVK